MVMSLVLGKESQEVFSASLWSCECSGLSSGSVLPKQEGKHRRVSTTQHLCQHVSQMVSQALILMEDFNLRDICLQDGRMQAVKDISGGRQG